VCFVLVLNRQYQMSLLLGNETSLGHEGVVLAPRGRAARSRRDQAEGQGRGRLQERDLADADHPQEECFQHVGVLFRVQ
jgi:hypothetical protein